MSREAARFAFLVHRDGVAAATTFLRENVIAAYRKVVTQGKTHTMYRRQMIESYVEAKRIVASV